MNTPVSIVPCPDYDEARVADALARAIDAVQGLAELSPGMRVGIKANLVSAMKPEEAATTHPALLASLTKLLLSRGAASVTVGDSPGGLYTPAFVHHVYRASGMEKVTSAGGILNENFEQRSILFEEAKLARSITYTAWLDDVDFLIDFSKLKSHGMMGMSNAVKNMFGIIPGTMKPEYHFRFPNPADFADMIVDLALFSRPRLSITDAIVCMEGNGPTKGAAKQVGAILASRDPHALDLVSAELIGLSPSEVPTLAAAIRRGLIPEHAEEIPLIGALDPLRPAHFETVAVKRSLLFAGDNRWYKRLFSRVAGKVLSSRPKPGVGCIGCEKCKEVCPAKAITMKEKYPVIDRNACIRCFCCQEFCPVGAMKVHRTPLARLLTK